MGWLSGIHGMEKVCPVCISKTVRCRKLILGMDMDWGVGVHHFGVTLSLKMFSGLDARNRKV